MGVVVELVKLEVVVVLAPIVGSKTPEDTSTMVGFAIMRVLTCV